MTRGRDQSGIWLRATSRWKVPVPVGIHTRRMVETSLEAVALCGASLLSDAFAPVPSPSERGFLNSSPQAEPSVQISWTGSPDDFCEDFRFRPLDAMCELTAARIAPCDAVWRSSLSDPVALTSCSYLCECG